MGIVAKTRAKNSSSSSGSSENWGTGLLLVFFPEDKYSPSSATAVVDKSPVVAGSTPFPSSSSSSSSASSPSSAIPNGTTRTSRAMKRSNSNNPILTKTQATISVCALFLFLTLLLFTLSTFEPTITTPPISSRRFLYQKPPTTRPQHSFSNWLTRMLPNSHPRRRSDSFSSSSFALQGMGKLYRRGTRAMNDLVVGHVVEDTNEDEFRLFLRILHRSGLTAKADVVFVFGSSSFASKFEALLREENDSFLNLVERHGQEVANRTSRDSVSVLGFDVRQFVKNGKKEAAEPLWGKGIRVNNYNDSEDTEGESTQLSFGSVVGFEASELDPENSLSGFLDHVPMSLRRWACYPMLLGRVRRNFKHIILVDVKNIVLLGDPLGRVRNRSPESVYMVSKQESSSSKHGRKNSDKTQSHSQVNSRILMGGSRGIRRLSNAMLMEIVRAAMQRKKKSPVTESGILNQLVGKVHVLSNINLITSTESIPDTSSLAGSKPSSLLGPEYHHSIIQHGITNRELIYSLIMKQICSCEGVDSSVYRDC